MYPDSQQGLTLRTSDQGKQSVVATYTNDGGLAKNLAFYRDEMETRGWNEVDTPRFPEELGKNRSLSFIRGDEHCSINLTPADDEDHVIICVVFEGDDAS